MNRGWITTAMGVLGTTITPYLFFWQSALEVEEEKAEGRATVAERRGATGEEIKSAHFDVNAGMVLSNLVMFFIITTTALTLFAHGKTSIKTAQDAAEALRPLAGNLAYLLFMLGMVGTGLLAIPALAGSSAYIAADTLSFRRPGWTKRRSARRAFTPFWAPLISAQFAFTPLDPILALYGLRCSTASFPCRSSIWLFALRTTSGPMGRWRNSLLANAWAWITLLLMGAAAVALFAV